MAAVRSESRLVARVFHPSADSDLVDIGSGINAVAVPGEAGYQLSTGETIKV